MGWGLGWGLGLFVQDVLRGREGRKRDGWPPPHSSNPWIPWLKITASWADMLIHAYIRANGGSWWIKSQTERQTPSSSRCLCSEIIFQGLYSHYQEVVLGQASLLHPSPFNVGCTNLIHYWHYRGFCLNHVESLLPLLLKKKNCNFLLCCISPLNIRYSLKHQLLKFCSLILFFSSAIFPLSRGSDLTLCSIQWPLSKKPTFRQSPEA